MTRKRLSFRHSGAFAAAVLALGLAASPASALNAVCEVLPTADGFAALRSAPSTDAPMIRRMPVSHGVKMRSVQVGRLVTSGRWVQVTHWPDGKFYEPGDAEFSLGRTGWVVHRLVGECG